MRFGTQSGGKCVWKFVQVSKLDNERSGQEVHLFPFFSASGNSLSWLRCSFREGGEYAEGK